MDVAVRTVNLRKTYLSRGSRRVAVGGLTMSVPHGGVHGFLGPNGSGKTTTIRMLLGLIRADSGTAEVFGTCLQENAGMAALARRMGFAVTPNPDGTLALRRRLD